MEEGGGVGGEGGERGVEGGEDGGEDGGDRGLGGGEQVETRPVMRGEAGEQLLKAGLEKGGVG